MNWVSKRRLVALVLLGLTWALVLGGCADDSGSNEGDGDSEDSGIVPECEGYAKLLCQCNYEGVEACEARYATWRNRTRECLNAAGCLEELASQCTSYRENLVSAWEYQCYSLPDDGEESASEADGDEIPFFPDGDEEVYDDENPDDEDDEADEDDEVPTDGDEEILEDEEASDDEETPADGDEEDVPDLDGDTECPEYEACATTCAPDASGILLCEWLDHPDIPGCQFPHVTPVSCEEGTTCMDPNDGDGDFELDCYEVTEE